ncbi:MAG: low molecular weight protein-tyrosine-phosphatase [Gammaproteobacteria bacterium]
MLTMDRLINVFSNKNLDSDQELIEEAADVSVLFVCMGNICRSPTAEGAFRRLLDESSPDLSIRADSAGTHAYHIGHPPDDRAQSAASRRGIDISDQRARKVADTDFETFDFVLAMDEMNLDVLVELSPADYHDRIKLFMDYAPKLGRRDVPDPYYGGLTGFELVLDLVEEASQGLLQEILKTSPASD